jgi:hypothetical protein
MALLSLFTLLSGLAVFWAWKRRQNGDLAGDGSVAFGLRKTIESAEEGKLIARPPKIASGQRDEPSADLAGSASAGPIVPRDARLDLKLDIESASRSLMRFSIEFGLEITNRDDVAVRDISITAKLASAQAGGNGEAIPRGGQPVAEVERIAPGQGRRVMGRLQIPLSEVTPLNQGGKLVLIPLIHVTLEGPGLRSIHRSFVIGTPSSTSMGRVHPLLLDGPPGGFPPLRAQLIKQQEPA